MCCAVCPTPGDPELGWCGLVRLSLWSGPTWCGPLLLYVVRSYIAWSGPTPGDLELDGCGLVLLYVVRSEIVCSGPVPGDVELGCCALGVCADEDLILTHGAASYPIFVFYRVSSARPFSATNT